jgi:plasmid replication initiation protein
MDEVKEKDQAPNMIVFARQSFTALQKDIFTLAVMQLEAGVNVQPDLFKNQTVTVSIKMLNTVSERKYDRLKQECKSLQLKQLEISDDEKEEFDFIIPFPRITYRKGVIELMMLADVAQSFLDLKKGYAEYYIRESLSLEQFNKKRLYEMLSSYKRRNFREWKVYDDKLKYLLDMKPSEYKGRPKEFCTKIIEVCVNAINELTSIAVTYTRDKDSEGWFTVFKVDDKKKLEAKATPAALPQDEKSLRLVERLKTLGMRQDFIQKIVIEHQQDCWKWLSVNKESLENKKFKNPAGVLLVHLGLIEPKIKS